MPGFPAVRASAIRDTLAYLDRFEPGMQARVIARVPRASMEVIRNTPRAGWVSVEHDHFTVDNIVALLGPERALRYWRGSLTNLLDRPLLRSFVNGMLLTFGRDPARVISLFPKGWGLVYRDTCSLELVQGPEGQPVLRFLDVAPAIRTYNNYFYSWRGALQGFADIARVRGDVRFTISPDFGSAEAAFSWK